MKGSYPLCGRPCQQNELHPFPRGESLTNANAISCSFTNTASRKKKSRREKGIELFKGGREANARRTIREQSDA